MPLLGLSVQSSAYLALCLAASFFSFLAIRRNRKFPLPPIPPSDPIIGHARHIPLDYSWKTFASWRKKFGDIIYVHVLGTQMIVLNSANVARDILEKRSAIFSDRPWVVVVGEMMGWSTSLPFPSYGDRFRRQRCLMRRYFDARSVEMFRAAQEQRVQIYLDELLYDPEDYRAVTQRLIAGVVLKTTYGYSALRQGDPLSDLLSRAATAAGEAGSVGATSIDLFPILLHVPLWFPSWFPGVLVKRHSMKARTIVEESIAIPFENLKARRPCFVSQLLDEYEMEKQDDSELYEDIKMLGAVVYTAGFETTTAAILTFFLMMTLHEDVLKKAQAEIDSVVGTDRLPTFDDRSHLPYIDCIVKEIYRINPSVPPGLPHRAIATASYENLTIPKGCLLVPNIWQMTRDGKYFPEPETFIPERHWEKVEDKHGVTNEECTEDSIPMANAKDDDPSNLVFGFGRRICPGRFFADRTLWLVIACTLATFDIKPFSDPSTGTEVLPEVEYLPTVVSFPKPFKSPRAVRDMLGSFATRETLQSKKLLIL